MKAVIAVMTTLLLGACAVDGASDSFAPIQAPTRESVAKRITQADDGVAVQVSVGSLIAVELVGVPTAGYLWSATAIPPFLSAAGQAGGPTTRAQLEPGFAGGEHWEVFYFEVAGQGEGLLRFELRRPWEEDEAPDSVFTATIKAQ